MPERLLHTRVAHLHTPPVVAAGDVHASALQPLVFLPCGHVLSNCPNNVVLDSCPVCRAAGSATPLQYGARALGQRGTHVGVGGGRGISLQMADADEPLTRGTISGRLGSLRQTSGDTQPATEAWATRGRVKTAFPAHKRLVLGVGHRQLPATSARGGHTRRACSWRGRPEGVLRRRQQ